MSKTKSGSRDGDVQALRTAAERMIRRGFRVIPVPLGAKGPKREGWPDLHIGLDNVPTEFAEPMNLGIVLGRASGGLVDIDLDSEEAVALSSLLPATAMIHGREGRRGSHFWYRVEEEISTKKFVDTIGEKGRSERGALLEIRSDRHYTLIPPSIHPSGESYCWEKDGEPGSISADTLLRAVHLLYVGTLLVKHYPPEGHRHNFSLALAGTLLESGVPEEDARSFVRLVAEVARDEEVEDRVLSVSTTLEKKSRRKPITSWSALQEMLDERIAMEIEEALNLRASTSAQRRSGGGESEGGKGKKPRNQVPKARFDTLVDIVEHDGKLAFLVINENSEPEIVSEVEGLDGEVWIPPPADTFPVDVIPRGSEVLARFHAHESIQHPELFDGLREFISRAARPPEPVEDWLDLLATWVIHTYAYERFQYSPYLYLFAVPERGKTRLGLALCHLSYRGYHTATPREAHLFRMSEHLGATLFIDVRNLMKKLESGHLEDILLLRFQKSAKVARVLNPEKGAFLDTYYYKVYGPTIIATNEPVDSSLSSRCIPISMPEAGRRKWEDPPTPQEARPLREALTAWRARVMSAGDRAFPITDTAVAGRLGDIAQPLLTICFAINPEALPRLERLIQQLATQRTQESSTTLEGEVVLAILQSQVRMARIPLSEITREINKGRERGFQLSPQKVGAVVRSLGFNTRPIAGRAEIEIGHELLSSLCERYGIFDDELEETERLST